MSTSASPHLLKRDVLQLKLFKHVPYIMENKTRHPISLLIEFCERRPEIEIVELSVYKYQPQSIEDERDIIQIPTSSLEEEFMHLTDGLRAGEEVAFHSRVYIGQRRELFHIPMIDFSGKVDEERLESVLNITRDFGGKNAALFASGRSFHLYIYDLLKPAKWLEFMGRLLLLNLPGGREIVDARWIGHRLIAQYGALRWSKNTNYYKAEPQLTILAKIQNGHIRLSDIDKSHGSHQHLKKESAHVSGDGILEFA